MANNQFNFEIYKMTIRWCRTNGITCPQVVNGTVHPWTDMRAVTNIA